MNMLDQAAKALRDEALSFRDPVESYVEGEFRHRWHEKKSDGYTKEVGAEDYAALDDVDTELESWKILVRAVLQGMREPSEAMIAAGSDRVAGLANWGDCDGPAPLSAYHDATTQVWQTMIDAALEEGDAA